jgi:peptidoglycan/xylan/chitin deacetylase (PgdA/CDA1 family)
MPLSRTLKVAAVHVLYYCGILSVWQHWALRRRAVVLMYHRVLTEEELRQTASHPAITVTSNTFARQMALLKKRFRVLSLEQFVDHLERKVPFRGSSVVITFDDGWRDNYTNALPILRRHGLPALVLLPSAYVNTDRLFWQETLVHLLLVAARSVQENQALQPRLACLLGRWSLDQVLDLPQCDLRSGAIAAVGRLKTESRHVRQELIDALAAELGVATSKLSDVDAFIGWDELREMSRSGITFGGHGVDHLLLTQVSGNEVEEEIIGSRQFLDQRLDAPIATFSYPNGYLNTSIVEKVRSTGYRVAFTTKRGLVSCTDDPMAISRFNIHETVTSSNPMFLARLVGLL